MPKKGKKGKKAAAEEAARLEAEQKAKEAEEKRKFEEQLVAVSYTHLTLPTILLV